MKCVWLTCSLFFFFFKQKTAYEMRISDWSSDVCSSDLQAVLPSMPDAAQAAANWQGIDLQLLFECCVDLGFEAADTAGNALETAGWLNAHGYKSIRLVTPTTTCRAAWWNSAAEIGRANV